VSVRCDAIELLGQFGEVDIIERVILLPLTDGKEIDAVAKLVQHLLRKPRSVVHLSPRSFEQVAGLLLEKMVTLKGSWDEGVDVVAHYRDEQRLKPERQKVVVQCKRYQAKKLVAADVVDTMVASLQNEQAAHGIIITTSGFAPQAIERGRKHRHIELIDGSALQELFDKHFGKGHYRVVP
jgi:restriction endonuclease Mrr